MIAFWLQSGHVALSLHSCAQSRRPVTSKVWSLAIGKSLTPMLALAAWTDALSRTLSLRAPEVALACSGSNTSWAYRAAQIAPSLFGCSTLQRAASPDDVAVH